MTRPASLIALCVECYDSYSPSRVTPFAHVDHFLRAVHPHLSQPQHSSDAAFITDVLYSLDRLHDLLTLTVDGLYEVHAADIARHDRSLYRVMALLCLDKLPLMEWETFVALCRSQPPHTLRPLLAFLFDRKWQDEWMREQWQTIYDVTYVDQRLLPSLRQFEQPIHALIQEMTEQIQSNKDKKEGSAVAGGAPSKLSTVVVPFSLSASRPKALPLPLALPCDFVAHPVSRLRQRSLAQIEEENKARRDKVRQQVNDAHAKVTPFTLSAVHRPSTLPKAILDQEERLKADTAQLTFAHPAPDTTSCSTTTTLPQHKTTTAAILREEELYRRQREQEAERLLRYEREMRDSGEFDRWRADRRKEDDDRRKEEVARRKAEMARSHVEAQLSVERSVDKKTQAAATSKEEMEQRRAEVAREEEKEVRRKEQQAKAIAQTEEEAVAAALHSSLQRKKEKAHAVHEEKAEMAEQRKRQQAEEWQEKRRLMLKIQAMEQLASERAKRGGSKVVEESSTGGLMLLSDMSLVEMRERLALMERQQQEQLAVKRERIDEDKRVRERVLRAMEDDHSQRRQRLQRDKEQQRKEVTRVKQLDSALISTQLIAEQKEVEERLDGKRRHQLEAALQLAQTLKANRQTSDAMRKESEAVHQRMEDDRREADKRREANEVERAQRAHDTEVEVTRRARHDLTVVRQQRVKAVLDTREAAERRLAESQQEAKEQWDDQLQRRARRLSHIAAQREQLEAMKLSSNPRAAQLSTEDVQRGREVGQRRKEAEVGWKAKEKERLQKEREGSGALDVTRRAVDQPVTRQLAS